MPRAQTASHQPPQGQVASDDEDTRFLVWGAAGRSSRQGHERSQGHPAFGGHGSAREARLKAGPLEAVARAGTAGLPAARKRGPLLAAANTDAVQVQSSFDDGLLLGPANPGLQGETALEAPWRSGRQARQVGVELNQDVARGTREAHPTRDAAPECH